MKLTIAALALIVGVAVAVHPDRQSMIDEINSKQSLWVGTSRLR